MKTVLGFLPSIRCENAKGKDTIGGLIVAPNISLKQHSVNASHQQGKGCERQASGPDNVFSQHREGRMHVVCSLHQNDCTNIP